MHVIGCSLAFTSAQNNTRYAGREMGDLTAKGLCGCANNHLSSTDILSITYTATQQQQQQQQ